MPREGAQLDLRVPLLLGLYLRCTMLSLLLNWLTVAIRLVGQIVEVDGSLHHRSQAVSNPLLAKFGARLSRQSTVLQLLLVVTVPEGAAVLGEANLIRICSVGGLGLRLVLRWLVLLLDEEPRNGVRCL